MKATIETADAVIAGQLLPLVLVTENAPGHINYNYTHGSDYCNLDMTYKAMLMEQLQPLVAKRGWDMGCGAGHIWVAVKGEENATDSLGRLMAQRVLLITD